MRTIIFGKSSKSGRTELVQEIGSTHFLKAKNIRAHLIISGRVQGVWYRGSTKQQAEDLGLTGWVRNCESGQVEVVVEGADAAIDKLISWCRTGPSMARVTDVRIDFEDYSGEFVGFRVKR